MSLRIRCTVRGCGETLAREDARLVCPEGHAFDRAREGYWNLLQPQDRRSSAAGDRDQSVHARRRWLARGFADGLADTLARCVSAAGVQAGAAVADIGCGEGTLTARLFGGRDVDACGVDLSVTAVAAAARHEPRVTWLVANADRGLPFADGSLELAVSIFGRRPAAELHRALRAGGALIVALPGPDDLIELRATAQGEAARRDRIGGALAELGPAFEPKERVAWRHRARHDRGALEDALAMSYRGARASERERLEGLEALDVTLAAEIVMLVSRGVVQ